MDETILEAVDLFCLLALRAEGLRNDCFALREPAACSIAADRVLSLVRAGLAIRFAALGLAGFAVGAEAVVRLVTLAGAVALSDFLRRCFAPDLGPGFLANVSPSDAVEL
jgi:hypothetical protein